MQFINYNICWPALILFNVTFYIFINYFVDNCFTYYAEKLMLGDNPMPCNYCPGQK